MKVWAGSKSIVKRMWIYGSRARNDYSINSDLDIAIEIDPEGNYEDSYSTFYFEHKKWESELQKGLEYKVHLGFYNLNVSQDLSKKDGNVVKSVEESGILIYERK